MHSLTTLQARELLPKRGKFRRVQKAPLAVPPSGRVGFETPTPAKPASPLIGIASEASARVRLK
jgi:hypothetical protein